jgi:hypothetical protein
MFESLKDVVCFVTAFVSFFYGTRVAWVCGKRCQFSEKPEDRIKSLRGSIPAATIIYSFGFLIVFNYFVSGFLAWGVFSLTSAIVLSCLVVSIAMPELKRKPATKELVLVELTDGSSRQMAKKTLNVFLLNGRVVKFKRSDGWVLVGSDRLRDMNKKESYAGVERRKAA